MKTQNLYEMASEQLVRRFIAIGIAQATALLRDEIAKYNRLFDEKTAILAELKSRPGDQRRLLLPLFDHENVQVRLNAAKATLAVAPAAARRMIEMIATKNAGPQRLSAGMCIDALDSGIFKPT
jgi:recombinational DNA repair ATPase RecF